MSVSRSLDAGALAAATSAARHADRVDRDGCFPEETFADLRGEELLSLLVPPALGGQGASLAQVASVCHALAQSCGSSAMIFAMHQIQVACILAHGRDSDWHLALLQRVCQEQLLLGSVTSEAGSGGNIYASGCAIEPSGSQVRLEKNATTISYGAVSDALLITARRGTDTASSDQVMVVATRDDYVLERTAAWDSLGMRGTCSEGFRVRVVADAEQILHPPFADIASQTMLPVSHLLWSSVWLGIAVDAMTRARNYLRQQARNARNASSPGAQRLAKAVAALQLIMSRLSAALQDYGKVFAIGPRPLPLGFTANMNNLKTSVSELCLEVVQHAFMICGIEAYKNHSEFSLGRHFRDLLSAPIMINNDRMLESAGNLLLMQKPVLGTF
jgi:acyl-CoA dehydrogenase